MACEKLRVLIIGLGSIGQRHACLLQGNFGHQLFALRSGKGDIIDLPGVTMLDSWEGVDAVSPQVALVTNPTGFHLSTAVRCAVRGMHLFIEKPIDCTDRGLDDLLKVVRDKHLVAYVAYPLRFHPLILLLRKLLEGRKVLHAQVVCSSYLPDWRPGRDSHTLYSAKRVEGGGVLLDLSHELDYAEYLFGSLNLLKGRMGRVSDVTIDAEDYADLVCEYERAAVNIHLNYFSRQAKRDIGIDLKNGHIQADLLSGNIRQVIDGKVEEYMVSFGRDDMFLEQLRHFFGAINGAPLINDLASAARLFRKLLAFREEILV
ncbi:MAG: Gfo/Idh/MocA family oxidoreductase [Candidatus Omnitrophica bacterium]|nr:Gfo/Idh/MocA family oxidoreductase [Candidatus Omnitrophota bacterium]